MSLLEIKDLEIRYNTDTGVVRAVNGVSLSVEEGESVGLVGETGAGKTTTALGVLDLIQVPPGEIVGGDIFYKGKNLRKISIEEMREIRGSEIAMIFQDPMTALNPIMTVGEQIAEGIKLHQKCSDAESMRRACEMLEMVRIPASRANEYPHQFSGGMKQRVVIAMALACNPALIIADEPTTALDVTIQAQVLEMINELKEKLNTSMLLITHDLGIIAECCQKAAVMYAGEIVEYGTVEHIFNHTAHPYTVGLFNSIPKIGSKTKRLNPIEGLVPDPTNLPEGCKFHPRCPYATEKCAKEAPPVKVTEDGHMVRCHNSKEV